MADSKSLYPEKNARGYYQVKWTGGGELPDDLKGMYTSLQDATTAIAVFQAGVRNRVQESTRGRKPSE